MITFRLTVPHFMDRTEAQLYQDCVTLRQEAEIIHIDLAPGQGTIDIVADDLGIGVYFDQGPDSPNSEFLYMELAARANRWVLRGFYDWCHLNFPHISNFRSWHDWVKVFRDIGFRV